MAPLERSSTDLSGCMKERQLQAIVGVARKNTPQKFCRVCGLQKNVKTPDISATPAKFLRVKKLASRDTTPG
jgi:hypothetical protein